MQISELFSMEICDKAVMDFLAATDVGKFPPGWGQRCLSLSARTEGSRWKLRHLTGSLGGGGDKVPVIL